MATLALAPPPMLWLSVVEQLRKALLPAGILIVHPFSAQSYNTAVTALGHAEWRLPDYGRSNTLALLLGSTKDMWPLFTAFVREKNWLQGEDLGRVAHPDPFDEYLDMHIASALRAVGVEAVEESEITGTSSTHVQPSQHSQGWKRGAREIWRGVSFFLSISLLSLFFSISLSLSLLSLSLSPSLYLSLLSPLHFSLSLSLYLSRTRTHIGAVAMQQARHARRHLHIHVRVWVRHGRCGGRAGQVEGDQRAHAEPRPVDRMQTEAGRALVVG